MKLFAALNPHNRPVNPPAVTGSQTVRCGLDTALPVGNYDHSAYEQWLEDDRRHNDPAYAGFAGNCWSHNDPFSSNV